MTAALLLAVIALGVLAHALYQHGQFLGSLRSAPTPPRLAGPYPSISVVRPVRGRDVGAEDNFAAALLTGYPGEVETLFVVDDAADPSYPLLRAAIAAHQAAGDPGTARLLVAGAPPPGRTGKLHAMMAGMRVAKGELIAFGDSDSRPDQDVLRVLVETLVGTAQAGCAFAPVVVPKPAVTAGDVGYALLINGLYGPAVTAAARPTGDLPFIMGQLMVLRREALKAAGGLDCADGHLVDDMQIGKCVAAAGWRNIPSSHPLRIETGGMDLPSFLKLMRRWLFFQRGGLPQSFTTPLWLRGIEFAFGMVAGLGLLVTGHYVEAVPPLLVMGVVAWSVASLHRAFGGAPLAWRHLAVPFGLFLAGMAAHVLGFLRPAVQWRGREYTLDSRARLGSHPDSSPNHHPPAHDPAVTRSRS